MTKKLNSKSGFTLIELLVVVAIISLISSVVLASFSGARENAQYTSTVQDFQQIEKAFNVWMTNEGRSEWFTGEELCESGACTIGYLLNTTSLSDYLPADPRSSINDLGFYTYASGDIGGNRKTCPSSCENGDSPWNQCGIYLYISVNGSEEETAEIRKSLENVIGEDTGENARSCGKFRQSPSNSFEYMISEDYSY